MKSPFLKSLLIRSVSLHCMDGPRGRKGIQFSEMENFFSLVFEKGKKKDEAKRLVQKGRLVSLFPQACGVGTDSV